MLFNSLYNQVKTAKDVKLVRDKFRTSMFIVIFVGKDFCAKCGSFRQERTKVFKLISCTKVSKIFTIQKFPLNQL